MTDRTTRGSGAKGPDELRRQIAQTRSQLGDTIEELAAKADVKGRARARGADLKDKAGAMTVQLRGSAAHAGHAVQGKAAQAGHAVQGRAVEATHAVQGRAAKASHAVQGRVARASEAVEHGGMPRPVRTVAQAGLRHPRPVLVAGAVAGAVIVAAAVLRRRHCGR
ncbi:DUF3618 domain-containing protein [Streptomyces sp. TRM72054]|uniref:DUF3618 domain-containing protein n=1 Tax=Streptomyces sp. TRM72054 TaxID=2870562 RepID=UPI001C8C6119|nr:DUF3618 domain-containing protein [Streptomyces sp. TRM72054]MBX9393420.1 DUF3618 domain-containing protein [Streptomyces sp. TRM72054]